MTADSTPLPPWAEFEKHVRRAEQQIQEERDISTVQKWGIVLTIIGFGALLILVVGILSDREQWEPWRAVVSPLAHLVGIGGMIMVAAAWVTGMLRHHASHHRERADSNDNEPRHRHASRRGRSQRRIDVTERRSATGKVDEPKQANENEVTGTIIAMPNKKIYELGIHEGERRERERRRKDDPNT